MTRPNVALYTVTLYLNYLCKDKNYGIKVPDIFR
jgi:hypothetical protein